MKYIYIIAVFFVLAACSKDKYEDFNHSGIIPSDIATGEVSENVGLFAVVLKSEIGDTGGISILDKGVIYTDKDTVLNINTGKILKSNSKSLEFTDTLSSLTPGVKYRYKTYALNSRGIAYGEEKEFIAKPLDAIAGTLNSELLGKVVPATIYLTAFNGVSYYMVADIYGEGYNLIIEVVDGKKEVSVPFQPARRHPTYGIVSVKGTGTFEGNVFEVILKHTVAAGSLGEKKDIITIL